MNYKYIINPLTNKKHSIHSLNGRRILKIYIKQLGGGPSLSPTQQRMAQCVVGRQGQAGPSSEAGRDESHLIDIFAKQEVIINGILDKINNRVCVEVKRKYKSSDREIWRLIKDDVFKEIVNISRFYYELYKTKHPLALIYANLYIDFLMSKIIMRCNEFTFLTENKRYEYFHDKKRERKRKIQIKEQEYIETIKKNSFMWWSGADTPSIYWDNMSFVDNRKVLLKELFLIKNEFGKDIFNKYYDGYSENEKKRGRIPKSKDDGMFKDIKENLKSKIPLVSSYVRNYELLEEHVISDWNWDEIYKYVEVTDVGNRLSDIIKERNPYDKGGWGMFRLFNLVSTADFGDGIFYAYRYKTCSCICNSLIFITILLITGYKRDCIFARMDKKNRDPEPEPEKASHWGVDIKCTNMPGILTESFFNCGLRKIGQVCAINKNIFHRYTTDILPYYAKAIESRRSSGLDDANISINYGMLTIIKELENNIKQFVDDDPCIEY
mgnify:FL=1